MPNRERGPIDPESFAKDPPEDAGNPYAAPAEVRAERPSFLLAALGAWLAAGYWGVTSLLYGASVSNGKSSPVQVIMPLVLVGLYAWRGFQILKGDANAIRRIIWLHLFGGVMAILQIFLIQLPLVQIIYGVKILIHIFGAITGKLARDKLKSAPTYEPL